MNRNFSNEKGVGAIQKQAVCIKSASEVISLFAHFLLPLSCTLGDVILRKLETLFYINWPLIALFVSMEKTYNQKLLKTNLITTL